MRRVFSLGGKPDLKYTKRMSSPGPIEIVNGMATVSALLMSLFAVVRRNAKDSGVSLEMLNKHDAQLLKHDSRLDGHDSSLSELNATAMHLGKLAEMSERADAVRGAKMDKLLELVSEVRGEMKNGGRR